MAMQTASPHVAGTNCRAGHLLDLASVSSPRAQLGNGYLAGIDKDEWYEMHSWLVLGVVVYRRRCRIYGQSAINGIFSVVFRLLG